MAEASAFQLISLRQLTENVVESSYRGLTEAATHDGPPHTRWGSTLCATFDGSMITCAERGRCWAIFISDLAADGYLVRLV